MLSVAYSPDGRHIISGSSDNTIQMWDAKIRPVGSNSLEGHNYSVQSTAYPPDYWNVLSSSTDKPIQSFNPVPPRPSATGNQISPHFHAQPDREGWVKDSEGGLLYWVPLDCRIGLHSPALLTIPRTSDIRSVSLDFNYFTFGSSWTHVFNTLQS